MYPAATIATYSQAWRAMNSSVPPLSPPLISAALMRMPTTTATIAMNSVVLNALLVSVVRRWSARVRSTARRFAWAVAAIGVLLGVGWIARRGRIRGGF